MTLLYSCKFQATRIGRTINLVRKKTSNEELSKRLKRIVKKWQALLVSLNSKKNSKSDSPSNFIPSTGNINGTISKTELLERPKSRNGNDHPSSCTPDQQKKAKKRKLTRAENSPLNPKPISSPKAKSSSPNLHLKSNYSSTSKSHSPIPRRLGAGSPCISNVRSDSPKSNSKVHSPSTSSLNTKQSKVISKVDLNSVEKSVGIRKEIVYNNLNKTHIERDVGNNQQKQKINISQNDLRNTAKITIHNFADIEKSKDTRIQENRIVEEAKHQFKNNSIDKKETHIDHVEQKRMINKEKQDHYSENIGSNESGNFILPKCFEPIESEELGINRRELPDNLLDVTSQADGVNGIFSTENEKESWHDWTEVIPQRSNELHLLPYVILD